ncbi:MAG: hypothetical protein OHK0024_23850 [Thalassobaculales bacterium]
MAGRWRFVFVVLANLITFGRILAVPLVVWLLGTGRYEGAFLVFVAAGLSDAVDGLLAKRFDAVTELGAHLDPVADKALLVSVYLTMGQIGMVPAWLVILVVFRDALIVGGVLFMRFLSYSVEMAPLLVSKVNTAMQIALAALVLADRAFDLAADGPVHALALAVAATTFASGAAYSMVFWRTLLDQARR